ncbi:adenosylcobinamide-GDP ribazoletransferase [Thermoflavimicrobium dichotomicum]|uniref:Adenosylcobinamide-GDP ribazoletransferase n=1 Tax=Thermoflavimicrobium dichotomicum TaxID=46223 RepID=A0A1I3MHV4_9BACL|nr:adenosylcobinamide-GDP ribazoletransferase [Thermoflavimicrobium dichotomicum]SFI96543.1 adenosylcobinamide-GDP ribazoletransferase [Thermoflavimicrobium dichotomicum]
MSSLLHAITFFTRIPLPVRHPSDDFAKCAMWLPVVGLLVGGILALCDWIFSFLFPVWVRAVLDVAIWVYLTGGLHLDGLMDTADGLGSYRSRERVLEIMHDSRVGAMGVLAAILTIFLKVSSIASLPLEWKTGLVLPVAAVISRGVAVWAIFMFPYVYEQGIGLEMKKDLKRNRFMFALAMTVVLSIILEGWMGLVALVLTFLFASVFAWRVSERLGGLTGDIYGALIEGSEVLVLLILLAWEVHPYAHYLGTPW